MIGMVILVSLLDRLLQWKPSSWEADRTTFTDGDQLQHQGIRATTSDLSQRIGNLELSVVIAEKE
jgi:hypothetical protein